MSHVLDIPSLMWCILFCSRPAVSAARLQAAAANSRTQAEMQPAMCLLIAQFQIQNMFPVLKQADFG